MRLLFKPLLLLSISVVAFSSCKKEEPDSDCNQLTHSGYTNIVTDDCGDGADEALLDGTRLEFRYDAASDSIFFLATVNALTVSQAIGVNVMLNIPNGGSTFNFWGNDNTAAYHKLITAWVTGSAPSSYSGTIGVADAAGVNAQDYTNLSANNISIVVNTTDKTIELGMKRTDVITNTEFSGSSITVGVAGAVGSNQSWNDDLHSASGAMTISM